MDEKKVINMDSGSNPKYGKMITFGLIALLLVVTAFNSFHIVPAGHSGVVVQLGAVQDDVLVEGFHFKLPFIQEVVDTEVRVRKAQSDQTAASKDLQVVSTTIAVNYHVNPNSVQKLYKHVGLEYQERIVEPAIGESLKAVTAQYTAEELISKRPEVSARIKESLGLKLAQYHIVLDEINITEFRFSDDYNKAIEQKQIAEQQALKAKLDLQRIEIEAQQTIESAKAEAESLRLQKMEVTPELIELRKIEAQLEAIKKWDGILPNVTGDSIPFIDVTDSINN